MKLAKTLEHISTNLSLPGFQNVENVANNAGWNFSNEKTELKTYLIDNSIIYRKIWGEKGDAAILKEFEIYRKILGAEKSGGYYLVVDDSEVIHYTKPSRRLFRHMISEWNDRFNGTFVIPCRQGIVRSLFHIFPGNGHYSSVDSFDAAMARIRKTANNSPANDVFADPDELRKKSKRELVDIVVESRAQLAEREKNHRDKIDQLLKKLLKINLNQNYEPQRFNAEDQKDPYYELFNAVDFLQSEVFDNITELKYLNKNLEEEIQFRTQELNEKVAAHECAEETLIKQHAELTRLHEELDKFVYHASHDLRAPIASIQGLINVAVREKSTVRLHQYLEMMSQNAVKLDNLIRDITNYSWNSRVDLDVEAIDFKELINEVFNHLSHYENFDRISRNVVVAGDESFWSDRSRLKIIFNNIIANALKFSREDCPEPFVKVEIAVDKESANITIADNGEGISCDHIGMIFDMFFCANTQKPGAGLGLYIVKGALDKLNGRMSVQSDLGAGTRFAITIPNIRPEQFPAVESRRA